MTIEASIAAVRQRVAAEDGQGSTDWAQAREDALQGLRTALLTVWGEDPGDERFVEGLTVGAIMAYTTACEAYDSGQLSLPGYLAIRERAVRTIELREGSQALVVGAAADIGPDAGNFRKSLDS